MRTTIAALLIAFGLVLVAVGDNMNLIIAGGVLCVAGLLVSMKIKRRSGNG